MKAAVLALSILLCGCTTLVVKPPPFEMPPIPPELLQPCEEWELPKDGSFAAVYESYVANATGPGARCIRKDDKLIEVLKYRAEVEQKLKEYFEREANKPWWQLW